MVNDKYLPRLIDETVKRYLHLFGAVELRGPMWSGKTWCAQHHANSYLSLSDPQIRDSMRLDLNRTLLGDKPHVIDEWQFIPEIWDKVRSDIDIHSGEKGRYILTGSSTPLDTSNIMHSGSGRFSRIQLRPMSLQESNESSGNVSLKGLFNGEFQPSESSLKLTQLADLIVRGGLPENISLTSSDAYTHMRQYWDYVHGASPSALPDTLRLMRQFIRSLARNVGSSPKLTTLIDDVYGNPEDSSQRTDYRKINTLLDYYLNRFVIEETYGWNAPLKSKRRLRSRPKYDFADSSLACSALQINSEGLINNGQAFGQMFEQMALRDIRIYASVLNETQEANVYYYRDDNGLEVDAIVELPDRRWGAIEIKLGITKIDEACENLNRLKQKISSNALAQNPEPEFMMVLVGICPFAFHREDGIYVVPIDCFGA